MYIDQNLKSYFIGETRNRQENEAFRDFESFMVNSGERLPFDFRSEIQAMDR